MRATDTLSANTLSFGYRTAKNHIRSIIISLYFVFFILIPYSRLLQGCISKYIILCDIGFLIN